MGFSADFGTPSAADPGGGAGCESVGVGTAGGVAGAVLFWSAVDLVPLDSLETTSAGDAFHGALAVALAEGRDLAAAVRFGAAAGALAVTRPGVQDAMPTRAAVETLLAEN